jgi:hypothetical protein
MLADAGYRCLYPRRKPREFHLGKSDDSKSDGSKSQPLAKFPRTVRGDVARLPGAVGFMYPKRGLLWGRGAGDCYGEFPRTSLPRTPVNKPFVGCVPGSRSVRTTNPGARS